MEDNYDPKAKADPNKPVEDKAAPKPQDDLKAKRLAVINKHLPDRGADGEALWGRIRRLMLELESIA